MFTAQPSTAFSLKPTPDAHPGAPSLTQPSPTLYLWVLALAGLLFSFAAANIVCLWPRWYSASILSLLWHSSVMVVIPAATGAAAVRTLWGVLPNPPAAGPTSIALHLSGSWTLLPCVVLLYEANSHWMLAAVAFASLVMALGLRVLLPFADTPAEPYPAAASLTSLNGLPPRDSPLLLSITVAVLTYTTALFAALDLALASLPAALAVFLFTWQWSGSVSRIAPRWLGAHPPLRYATAAIILTALCIIPFSVGGRAGIFHIGHRASSPSVKPHEQQDSSGAGYAGIILYPPPVKKQIAAPAARTDSFPASAHAKPLLIPFDGQYWYFKSPSSGPNSRAHVAHAKPTDVNVHSTDFDPLRMEAHQNLALPVNLAECAEIDLDLTNADIRPGQIDIQLRLTDSTTKGAMPLFTLPQPILSSQVARISPNRAPVHETLRLPLPTSRSLQRFNQITVIFQPSPGRARIAAKVSIEGFKLQPKP